MSLTNLLFTILLTLFYFFVLTTSFKGLSLVFVMQSEQPRVFMGFSTVVGISCFFLANLFYHSRTFKYILIFLFCLLCLSFINISLTFGNILHHQNTRTEIIATVLLSDLENEISKLSNPPKKPKFAMVGKLKGNSFSNKALTKYPILKKIMMGSFGQGNVHGHHKLKSLGFKFEHKLLSRKEKFVPSSQPILSRRIYDIYLENNDTFVVLFKK